MNSFLTIQTESSFNDGLGFPLVYLGLLYVTKKDESGGMVFAEWIVQGVLYEVVLASIMSAVIGYLIGMACSLVCYFSNMAQENC